MGYFIAPNGDYPRHCGDIQREHPDFIEGVSDLPAGWQEVAAGIVPVIDDTKETWFEIEPAEVDGVLTRQFQVRKLTAAELKAKAEQ